MNFQKHDIEEAVAKLAMLRFFPADEATRAAIGMLLARICPGKEELFWLVDEFINRIGEYRGPVEFRAVLATRWHPADGIDATSEIVGYRPCDGEARTLERHLQIKAQERVGGWVEIEGQKPARIAEESRRLIEGLKREWPQ